MFSILLLCLASTPAPSDAPCVIVVVGAPGTPEYAAEFRRWADLWQEAAKKGSAESIRIGLDDGAGVPDRDRLRDALAEKATSGGGPLWVVLIGHGTYDGREAKFNMRGPDVSDAEIGAWLGAIKRPVAFLDCTEASGPFLSRLSAPDRVIVAATKSGQEQNAARLGRHLAESIADPGADLDKDGQVSLLEAFLTAAGRVEESYRAQSRLATEHALIDDNGDKLGTPADWFRGVRATRRAGNGAAADGVRAHQLHLVPSDRERSLPPEARARRDRIERAVAALRDEKSALGDETYYGRLEALMVELARLYAEGDRAKPDHGH